jgi:uncharacterized membrane protein
MRALLPLLALAACAEPTASAGNAREPSEAAPQPEPARPAVEIKPATAPVVLPMPLRLVGTEPFWGGVVGPEEIQISGVDRETLAWGVRDPQRSGNTLRWKLEGGVTILVVRESCSDGMSDRTYPFRAEVTVKGEVLKGCAGPESLFRREG